MAGVGNSFSEDLLLLSVLVFNYSRPLLFADSPGPIGNAGPGPFGGSGPFMYPEKPKDALLPSIIRVVTSSVAVDD